MSDLISRDNLSKYKEKLGCNEPIEVNAYYGGWNDAIDCIIKNEPSAEPKKGRWDLHKSGALFICSACGETSLRTERYCPNCGALMEVIK